MGSNATPKSVPERGHPCLTTDSNGISATVSPASTTAVVSLWYNA